METDEASTQGATGAAPDPDARSAADPNERTSAGRTIPGPARRPPAPAGPASIQAGQWRRDPGNARFVYSKAPGVTLPACFDPASDRIDLTGRALDYDSLRARMTDRAWATEIALDDTLGAKAEDRLVVKGVRPADLTARNFIF